MKALFFLLVLSFADSECMVDDNQVVQAESEQIQQEESEQIQIPCFMCNDMIPECDSYFKYDPDHLVCIHCYYYRAPKNDNDVAPRYVSNNGKDIK